KSRLRLFQEICFGFKPSANVVSDPASAKRLPLGTQANKLFLDSRVQALTHRVDAFVSLVSPIPISLCMNVGVKQPLHATGLRLAQHRNHAAKDECTCRSKH